MHEVHPQFRTVVDVIGAVTVTGTLPGMRCRRTKEPPRRPCPIL